MKVKDEDVKEAAIIYSKGISCKLTLEEAFVEGALWCKQWLEDAEVSPLSDDASRNWPDDSNLRDWGSR